MKTKHTPGPWKRGSEIEGDEYACVVLGGEYNGIIARAKVDVYTTDEEAEANAKLIAAAPDLLKALQGVALWGKRRDGKFIFTTSQEQFDEFQAAINKATL